MDEVEDQESWRFTFPFQRGELLTRLQKFEYLKQTKEALVRICRMIDEKEEVVPHPPKNPREDLIQRHDKMTLQVWKRQKQRLEQRIAMLEQQIQQDIQTAKAE